MIRRVQGVLESIDQSAAHVSVAGGITYEVLVPAFDLPRLATQVGSPITLHTFYYLEAGGQGSNLTPRLLGFATPADRAFFQLFTSVKGIGPRKAMRAMSISTGQIAAAIAERDARMLQSLPEIGKRTAETIIAELHGKADAYAEGVGAEPAPSGETPTGRAVVRETLEVLVQLGEPRAQAMQWIDRVLARSPDLDDPEELLRQVFVAKGG